MKRIFIIQEDNDSHQYPTLKVNLSDKIIRGYEITEQEIVIELSADEVISTINEK